MGSIAAELRSGCRNLRNLEVMKRNELNVLGMFAGILFVSGCSVMGAPIVDKENRDQSGQYDGAWSFKFGGKGGRQYAGDRTLNCPPIETRTINFAVVDGSASVNLAGRYKYTRFHVNEKGQFQAKANTAGGWTSGGTGTGAGRTVTLKGKLDEGTGKGLYVIGMRQLNGEGCAYSGTFTNRS